MTLSPGSIETRRAALLMIEFQNEWLSEHGKLNSLMTDRAQFDAAHENGADALACARRSGLAVFHVGLRFSDDHKELGVAEVGLRSAIPRVGTFVGEAAAFPPPFTPESSEYVVSGRLGASGFAGSNLAELLRFRGIDTVFLAGFALHVCVESTLRHAHDLGFRTFLLSEATAAFTEAQRRHVLDHVVHHFGADISTDRFKEMLRAEDK